VVLCLHCGGSTQSTAPVEEPAIEAPKTAATAELEAAPEATPPPAEEASDTPSETPAASGSKTEGASPKKKCPELEKSECEIRTGCAWNSLGKCVEFGGGE
jgi:hypothetical protein